MRIVDAFVNPVFWGSDDAPEYVRHTIGETFHTTLTEQRPATPEAQVGEMDRLGIDHAILSAVVGSDE